MNRRKFLSHSSKLTIPLFLNGFQLSAYSRSPFSASIDNQDKVLVLIQLLGGNDGLNTLIPLESYDNLFNVRSNIIIPESKILNVNFEYGFHPAFSEMKDMHENGIMHVVQGVAYPNQNRSHFRSTDIWNRASSAEGNILTGWLGRYFESLVDDFPDGFPNDEYPHPFAMTIGGQVAGTCQGSVSNFSMAINKPEDLLPLSETQVNQFPDNKYGRALSYVSDTIAQTNAYAEVIKDAADQGSNLSTLYDDSLTLSQQLKTVAKLISGGLETQVYIVTLGGFDTHANQVEEDDKCIGRHAILLSELSKSINAFWDDISLLGLEGRVMGMTYSEFGRQIISNSGYGTDHGTAAPMFLFGNCLNAGLTGNFPEISDNVEQQEGTPMQFDFRSVYGNVLKKWFCVDEVTTQSILNHEVQDLNIFGNCNTSSSENLEVIKDVKLFPNPTSRVINLKVSNNVSKVNNILFLDHRGSVVNSAVKLISRNGGQYQYDISNLMTGNYFIHVQLLHTNLVKKFIKI